MTSVCPGCKGKIAFPASEVITVKNQKVMFLYCVNCSRLLGVVNVKEEQ